MRKGIIALSIILCFVVGLIVFAADSDFISAKLVDYKIHLGGLVINDNLQNPLISYNDYTYISVRDVAMMIAREIWWNEEREDIRFVKPERENHIIKKEDTALAIGKAIVEEHYIDRINENTKYLTVYLESGPSGIDYYSVHVMFNPPLDREVEFLEMINDCDVQVSVGAATGSASIHAKQVDSSWQWVSGRIGILEID